VHESPAEIAADRRGLVRLLNPFGRIWLRVVARLLEWTTDLIPSRLNFTWITESLAVGGAPRKRDYRRLAALGITAVIDAREEASDDAEALTQVGIRLLHLPTPDRFALSQEQLRRGTRWALERLAEGGKLFVHCQHGVGRGPLQGCAILIGQGLSAPEALRTMRTRRWQAAPNDRQIEGLLQFEERWKQELTGLKGEEIRGAAPSPFPLPPAR
jgi:protein-tyrosine phosphatase